MIVLTDDGPYLVGDVAGSRPANARLDRKDLTIKADDGAVRSSRLAPGGSSRAGLLEFVGGRITLEGMEFVLDPGDRIESLAAVAVEDTELTIRRCLFRRPAPRRAARQEHCRAPGKRSARDGDRAPAVVLDTCHLDGGQAGIALTDRST